VQIKKKRTKRKQAQMKKEVKTKGAIMINEKYRSKFDNVEKIWLKIWKMMKI